MTAQEQIRREAELVRLDQWCVRLVVRLEKLRDTPEMRGFLFTLAVIAWIALWRSA